MTEPKLEEKPEVKPSESLSKETPPPNPETVAPPSPPEAAKPPINGASSNSDATRKLLEEALQREQQVRVRLEKLEMESAIRHETRARLHRVFKPGFKVAKRGKS